MHLVRHIKSGREFAIKVNSKLTANYEMVEKDYCPKNYCNTVKEMKNYKNLGIYNGFGGGIGDIMCGFKVLDMFFKRGYLNKDTHIVMFTPPDAWGKCKDVWNNHPLKAEGIKMDFYSDMVEKAVFEQFDGIVSSEGFVNDIYLKVNWIDYWLAFFGLDAFEFKPEEKGILLSNNMTNRPFIRRTIKEAMDKRGLRGAKKLYLSPESTSFFRSFTSKTLQKFIDECKANNIFVYGHIGKKWVNKVDDYFFNTWRYSRTMDEMIQFIDEADYVVSVDSGAMHVAAALKKKTIGIFTTMMPKTRILYEDTVVPVIVSDVIESEFNSKHEIELADGETIRDYIEYYNKILDQVEMGAIIDVLNNWERCITETNKDKERYHARGPESVHTASPTQ